MELLKIIELLLSNDSEVFSLGLKLLKETGFCENLKIYPECSIIAGRSISQWIEIIPDIFNYFMWISKDKHPLIVYHNKNDVVYWCRKSCFLELIKFHYEHN